ncbi:hypothetical protein AB0I68_30245 [Streptomyces sp. NPDC050448]|uniref:hypothetical protein n=1 Tax=Streptomyces sp. NPDC050448 TaxID=3155404 RepID=UPI003411FDE7
MIARAGQPRRLPDALERREESLAPSEAAIRIHAELAAKAPAARLPELARALDGLEFT